MGQGTMPPPSSGAPMMGMAPPSSGAPMMGAGGGAGMGGGGTSFTGLPGGAMPPSSPVPGSMGTPGLPMSQLPPGAQLPGLTAPTPGQSMQQMFTGMGQATPQVFHGPQAMQQGHPPMGAAINPAILRALGLG